MADRDDARAPAGSLDRASTYAWYVLGLLFVVYALNFIDRQILSILAEDIKRDLHLRDEDLGFLYGTAFGVFYALFGIPLGRLADSWNRTRLLVVGLALWSTMTALSGLARSGGSLAGARIGVGVGEATAGPAAYSLISDWFPRRLRATALAIYSSGLYFGGGMSLAIGGFVVKRWNDAYPAGGPLGLVGWNVAFLTVGLPGLALAAWIFTLREPQRGMSDALPSERHPAPFRAFGAELLTIIPPLTLLGAARLGARTFGLNLMGLAAAGAFLAAMLALGEPVAQWLAIAIGGYAVYSWALALRLRDRPTFALIVANPALLAVIVAYGLNSFLAYTVSFWAAPYALRELGADPAHAGLYIGLTAAAAGFLGVNLGGLAADALRRWHPSGRALMLIFGAAAQAPFVWLAFHATSLSALLAAMFCSSACASSALPAGAATTQDLVLPRMRGTATAAYFVGTTLLGLALGPYLAGRVSSLTGSLSYGVSWMTLSAPIAVSAGCAAWFLIGRCEASRDSRADGARNHAG